ncbi:hypothetical protein CAEBREN_11253 [Caenorhabditis brenneri]|uniref:Smr domain-containing protein n=1 Tax=Caenorhabditis brenneri TaxID=135651 RepID=G0PHB2_CAEBE|nr:hypothetical protein CAEBREN_11253 [Caenorhabditis brenneri]
MASFRNLNELYRNFLDETKFGMKESRIDYLYSLYENDYMKTWRHLEKDKEVRTKMKELQKEKKSYKYPKEKDLLESTLDSINELAKQRNSMIFEKIKDCHPPQLVFDLHGFTVRSAVEYVYEIFDAMKQTPQRLMNNSEEIVFITGRGYKPKKKALTGRPYKSEPKALRIKAALLRTFQDTWQDEQNSGRVVMHFRKRLTYADALEDFFK